MTSGGPDISTTDDSVAAPGSELADPVAPAPAAPDTPDTPDTAADAGAVVAEPDGAAVDQAAAAVAAAALAAADAPPAAPPVASFRVMDVMDVVLDLPSQYPVVTLQESEPPLRSLVFPVGLPEATTIAYGLRRLSTPRPLSHALFADILNRYRIDLVAVRLTGRRQGTYLAELDLMGAEGRETVPCRPTDGLALALRTRVPAPILCDERLLEGDGDVEPV